MVGLSDVGVVRQYNEDNYRILFEEGVALVCDGMGGHKGGALASDIAVKTIAEVYQSPSDELSERIASDVESAYRKKFAKAVSAIRLANRHIYILAAQNAKFKNMGTTAVLVGFEEGHAVIANVGDSRLYRLRERELQQLTEDHSWVNELIADREIRKEDARHFERKNVITRALGMTSSVKIDLRIEPIQIGDLFLLCTDGLSNALNDDLIQAVVSNYQDDIKTAARQLVDLAKKADGSDNITVALIKVVDAGNPTNCYEPFCLKLDAENARISTLENKILKKQLGKSTLKDQRSISTFFKSKRFFIMLFIILLSLAVITICIKLIR